MGASLLTQTLSTMPTNMTSSIRCAPDTLLEKGWQVDCSTRSGRKLIVQLLMTGRHLHQAAVCRLLG